MSDLLRKVAAHIRHLQAKKHRNGEDKMEKQQGGREGWMEVEKIEGVEGGET